MEVPKYVYDLWGHMLDVKKSSFTRAIKRKNMAENVDNLNLSFKNLRVDVLGKSGLTASHVYGLKSTSLVDPDQLEFEKLSLKDRADNCGVDKCDNVQLKQIPNSLGMTANGNDRTGYRGGLSGVVKPHVHDSLAFPAESKQITGPALPLNDAAL